MPNRMPNLKCIAYVVVSRTLPRPSHKGGEY